jgi:hypothetical protein
MLDWLRKMWTRKAPPPGHELAAAALLLRDARRQQLDDATLPPQKPTGLRRYRARDDWLR